jgi:hypothetical protein
MEVVSPRERQRYPAVRISDVRTPTSSGHSALHRGIVVAVGLRCTRMIDQRQEPMINPLAAVTTSRSSKTGDACCIHGVGWNTCLAGEAQATLTFPHANPITLQDVSHLLTVAAEMQGVPAIASRSWLRRWPEYRRRTRGHVSALSEARCRRMKRHVFGRSLSAPQSISFNVRRDAPFLRSKQSRQAEYDCLMAPPGG